MNYNFLNTNLLTNMCNYNTTGASLTPYLFSGVDGLSVFTNYNNGYGSYGNYGYGSCSNTSSGVWGAIGLALGSVAASIGIGVAGKAINNHIAKNNAKEAQNKKDVEAFNKAIAELGLGNRSPLEITEKMIDDVELPNKTELETAVQNLTDAIGDDTKGLTKDLNDYKKLSDDAGNNIKTLEDRLNAAETEEEKAKIREQITALEGDKTRYDNKVKELEQEIANKKKELETAQNNLQKAEEDHAARQATAKQYLAKAQEAAREKFEGDIDDVDGNAFSRIGAKEVTIKDGNIEGKVDNFKDADWQKILAKWRKGDTAQKANIEAWLKENAEDINKSQINSTYRSFLNKICNKINVDNSES